MDAETEQLLNEATTRDFNDLTEDDYRTLCREVEELQQEVDALTPEVNRLTVRNVEFQEEVYALTRDVNLLTVRNEQLEERVYFLEWELEHSEHTN